MEKEPIPKTVEPIEPDEDVCVHAVGERAQADCRRAQEKWRRRRPQVTRAEGPPVDPDGQIVGIVHRKRV